MIFVNYKKLNDLGWKCSYKKLQEWKSNFCAYQKFKTF